MTTIKAGMMVTVVTMLCVRVGLVDRKGMATVRRNGAKVKEMQYKVRLFTDATLSALDPYLGSYTLNELGAWDDVPPDQRAIIKADWTKAVAEREVRMREQEQKRRTEALAQYVQRRQTVHPSLIRNEQKWNDRDDERVEWCRPGQCSSLITIYDEKRNGLPKVQLNWSAIGSVDIEEAQQFAEALQIAIFEAKERRALREAADTELSTLLKESLTV